MKDQSEENSMVTGAQFEESTERPEPEFERDTSLIDELTDIARLQAITSEIEGLVKSIGKSVYFKEQAE